MNRFPSLKSFLFPGVLTFVALTLPPGVVAEVAETIGPALQPFVDKHELAGAIALVADKDRVLAPESVGCDDIVTARAMPTDALFWIASQSKGMTAVAVMMLVDEGKLVLEDVVEKFLPEFRGQMVVAEKDENQVLLRRPAHPVTVREVLSHMSGLPFRSAMEGPALDGLALAAAVRSYAMTPLQTEPGTHYQYSNAGINTAARILEVVTMEIHPGKGLVLVWMVQDGGFPGEGGNAQGAFRSWALERFGK